MTNLEQIIYNCAEYSSFGTFDSCKDVAEIIEEVVSSEHLPSAFNVYPSMVETAGITLGESPIRISAYCGAYPTGQSYLEVKLLECAMAIENGADEVEIVANIGSAVAGDYDAVGAEIAALKAEIADEALLKVDIECSVLEHPHCVYDTAMAVMKAGADFVSTSAVMGEAPILEEVDPLLNAVKDYNAEYSRRVGVKFVVEDQQQLEYAILEPLQEILGDEWLDPSLLRLDFSVYQMQDSSEE